MTAVSRHLDTRRDRSDQCGFAPEKPLTKSIASVAPESSSLGDSSEQTGGKNDVSEGKRSIGRTMNFMHKGIHEAPECLEEKDKRVSRIEEVKIAFHGDRATVSRINQDAGRLSL